jgi:hypothetical protein
LQLYKYLFYEFNSELIQCFVNLYYIERRFAAIRRLGFLALNFLRLTEFQFNYFLSYEAQTHNFGVGDVAGSVAEEFCYTSIYVGIIRESL